MIEATIRTLTGPDSTQFQLIVSGHQGPDADPAHTAVTALVQTVTYHLARADWRVLQDFSLDGVPGSGWCAVTAVPTDEGRELVEGTFGLAAAGFALLARQFPTQLRFERQPGQQAA